MNILTIDTTTKTASVALLKQSKIFEKSISNEITHSEKLLPLVDEILVEHDINISNIDMFACLNGPGSFTGVRIGLSTIKGLSMVNKKKTFAINSLEALALTCYINNNFDEDENKYALSLIDAKNDRVYYSLYKITKVYENQNDEKKDYKLKSIPCIMSANDTIFNALKIVSNYILRNNISNDNFVICGDCVTKFLNIINNTFNANNTNNYFDMYPNAKDVITILKNISDTENYMFDTYTLDAMYVRPSQAERIKNDK